MIERIKAVQRMFWAMLATGVVVALLGVPIGDDHGTMAVFDELQRFAANFDRAGLERSLLAQASAQGVVGLDSVARSIAGAGVPKVTATPAGPAIAPRAVVSLATLAEASALAQPSATIALGAPEPAALGQALSWRLSRQPPAERYELQAIAVSDGHCSDADVKREAEVSDARAAMLRARAQSDAAQKQAAQAQETYELRRKWKATWKVLAKSNEARVKAQAAANAAQRQLGEAERAYEAVAKRAESFDAHGEDAPSSCRLAVVSLRALPAGKALELHIPAALVTRNVPVQLQNVDLPAARNSPLWNELKDHSPTDALAIVRTHFSWHYRYAELSGIKVGGMTVLQLAPLVLLPIFFGLMRRSRGVGASYNPFDRPNVEALPRVGFGASTLNALVLIALPFVSCALCAVSLLQVGQIPLVPALCALGCVGLGSASHLALKELLELREAITRSHSNPPPAPAR